MRVLGMAFSGHGTSMALVEDGRVVRAVNLERLTRRKFSLAALAPRAAELARVATQFLGYESPPRVDDFYAVFPPLLRYLTGEDRLERAGIDLVVKSHDATSISHRADLGAARRDFDAYFGSTRLVPDVEHHLTHAYQAYLCSPFEETAVLTVDGSGEPLARLGGRTLSTTFAVGRRGRVEVLDEIALPHSIGALYAGVTLQLGFREEQEGNTMALAGFGSDALHATLRPLVTLFPDGRYEFKLNPDGSPMYLDALRRAFPRRARGAPLEQVHKDAAWACQAISEEILINAARALRQRTGLDRLALAGGVALNCVANTRILAESGFRELYVMPNAGDRGMSVGCALYGAHVVAGAAERRPPTHDYLGREYDEPEILAALGWTSGVAYRKCADVASDVAGLLADGKIVGWVQGGAEFGPRALGHRSIVADPRTVDSKERLDREIKKREWFRPYAPSVLREHASEYFEMTGVSPYMLLAVRTRPEMADRVRGIVHTDGSARVQTVDREQSPRYRRLIEEFHRRTGVPMVLNTSFNGYGEPMVESPGDALKAFRPMSLDALAIGDYLVWRDDAAPP